VSETLHEDDRALLTGAPAGGSAGDFLRSAPLIEEDTSSEMDEGEPENLAPAQPEPREAWMEGSGSMDRLAPEIPKARTFAEHLRERKSGGDLTRLQAMRKHFGWKALRPRWWSRQSRDYQTAHKAEKLRYQGFGLLAKRASGTGREPDDRTVVDLYSQLKGELKSAAGYNPFRSKFWKYWGAKKDLKAGRVSQDEKKLSALDRFVKDMPTFTKNARHKEELAKKGDGDLAEVQALLNDGAPQMDSQPAGPGNDRDPMVPDDVQEPEEQKEEVEPSLREPSYFAHTPDENDDYLDIGEEDNAGEGQGAGVKSNFAEWLENNMAQNFNEEDAPG
jgi:hypothetical protein